MAVTLFYLWSDSRALSLYSAITGVSPTDGSPSNLPLERLQSAGDESLERFQPLKTTGVTPVRLLDTTDTMCSKSPCHQPFSVSEQRLDTQDNFFVKPAGPDCVRSVGVALGRRVQSQCSLLVFPRQVGGGSESRDPHMLAQGDGRRVVAGTRQ